MSARRGTYIDERLVTREQRVSQAVQTPHYSTVLEALTILSPRTVVAPQPTASCVGGLHCGGCGVLWQTVLRGTSCDEG